MKSGKLLDEDKRIIEKITKANQVLANKEHFLISSSGYSRYVTDQITNAMLTKEEAAKAMSMHVHIGVISEHEDYHGSHEGDYMFFPIQNLEQLLNYFNNSKITSNRISIDPAYEYTHIGADAVSIAEIKAFIQKEILRNMSNQEGAPAPLINHRRHHGR